MDEILPEYHFSGTAWEIGETHGRVLKSRILQTLDFYRKIWAEDDEVVIRSAMPFKEAIKTSFPHYADEIEGIAAGSEIDPMLIYALNSRSEILSTLRPMNTNECTAVYAKDTKILAQNWDWAQEMEKLIFLMRIDYKDYSVLQMTEPGIIGKIGFNSYGVGVCLNFLKCDKPLFGIPIHVLLRAVLDSPSIEKAWETVLPHKTGKSANILIGDAGGRYLDIEFAGDRIFTLKDAEKVQIHTNHYLRSKINTDEKEFASSFARYDRAVGLISHIDTFNVESVKAILADKGNSLLPICRKYVPDELIGNVGTVTSIVMELEKREMHITKGNPIDNPYTTIYL